MAIRKRFNPIDYYRDASKNLSVAAPRGKYAEAQKVPLSTTGHLFDKLAPVIADAINANRKEEFRSADQANVRKMIEALTAPQTPFSTEKYGTSPEDLKAAAEGYDGSDDDSDEQILSPEAQREFYTEEAKAVEGAYNAGDPSGAALVRQQAAAGAYNMPDQRGFLGKLLGAEEKKKMGPASEATMMQVLLGDKEKRDAAELLASKRAHEATVAKALADSKIAAARARLNSPTGRPASPIQNFAERQRLVGIYGEKSPEVGRFDDYVRSTKIMNLGGTMAAFNPANPSQPTAQIPVTLKPGEQPEVRAAQAEALTRGKDMGEAAAKLAGSEAALPRLESAITQLKKLGETATYTYAGQARDAITRQFGGEAGEGAKSRAAYIAHVKNNVLPLLRLTFGAAFTVAEGDSLLATLGDPNASPGEKNAVLDAFISDKKAEIGTLRRHAGPAAPSSKPKTMRFDAQGNLIP